MHTKVLLLHGWGGSDTPHWQSWLAGEIAKDYGSVSFLKFSNFDFPDIDVWKKELLDELSTFRPDIVICHSLANTLWFHLCNEKSLEYEVQKLFLVAPPSMSANIEELQSFFPVDIPSKLYAADVHLVGSTNDPYIDMQELQELQKILNVEMTILQNAGHINAESGYGKWDWILNKVKR
jgi:predicted alpha/beta hydrolase family esterase